MTTMQRSCPEEGTPRVAGGGTLNDFDLYSLTTDCTAVYTSAANALALENSPWKVANLLRLFYAAIETANEAGEILGQVKKILRDDDGNITQTRIQAISDEIGDTLYGLARVCRELGISLGDAALKNKVKLQDRKERGVLHGSGDNR